jgi:hypothetical protein
MKKELIFLTTEEIQKKTKSLNKKGITYSLIIAISIISIFVTLYLSFVQISLIKEWGMDSSLFGVTFFLAIFFICISCAMLDDVADDLVYYEAIPQQKCQEILSLINATAEGQSFQKLVLKENRQFIYFDLFELEAWTKTAPDRQACKELYQI